MAGELTTFALSQGIGLVTGAGVPDTIVIDGKTYNLLTSRTTGEYLTSRTTGEPIYGRAA